MKTKFICFPSYTVKLHPSHCFIWLYIRNMNLIKSLRSSKCIYRGVEPAPVRVLKKPRLVFRLSHLYLQRAGQGNVTLMDGRGYRQHLEMSSFYPSLVHLHSYKWRWWGSGQIVKALLTGYSFFILLHILWIEAMVQLRIAINHFVRTLFT